MRALVTADLHLGFRALAATTEGRNAREVDVETAWRAVVDVAVDEQLDLVLIGGDIVHHPRVGMHAVQAWRDGIRRIVTETNAHVVAVQGNHDCGRTADVLSPIVIPNDYDRVHIVLSPKRIRLDLAGRNVSVAAFPFVGGGSDEAYRLDPDEGADVNVLLLHAAVKSRVEGSDKLPYFYMGERAIDVGREAERFDIIACGDYHEFTRLHPDRLACYPGSIERTSSNIWNEHMPKGVVLVDTDTGSLEFVRVPTRPMLDYDLGDFDMPPGAGARELRDVLDELSTYEAIDDAIVRLKVDAFPREERADIDWRLVRDIKKRCLHFELDIRYAKREASALGDRRDRNETGLSLAAELASFTEGEDDDVRALMARYMGVEMPEDVPDLQPVPEEV